VRTKKVVVVGGGTGTYQTLTGLKNYSSLKLSAVISMCDSGGSTGRLRRELGILPPGDVRRAILALSDLPFAQKTLEEVFDFRFKGGRGLVGHSLGNILLAALTQITGSMDRAINEAARILNASGKVFPVTLDKTHLVAVLEDGTRIHGETKIDRRRIKPKVPIKRVYLNPAAKVFPQAAKVLREADLIVLGPGDLYTSIIPTLLVDGVNKALEASRGKIVYIVNLLTKKGETDGFLASDFVRAIEEYLEGSRSKLAVVLANNMSNQTGSKIALWYKKHGSAPVVNDLTNEKYRIVTGNFSDTTTFYRHSPEKLAKAIIGLL